MRLPPTPERLKEQRRAQRERYLARYGRERLRAAAKKYYDKTRGISSASGRGRADMSGVADSTPRNLLILARAESGLTLTAIGVEFRITKERVRQIIRDLGGWAAWREARKAELAARRAVAAEAKVIRSAEVRAREHCRRIAFRHTVESKAKIAASKLGKKRPPRGPEWRAKISAGKRAYEAKRRLRAEAGR